MLLIGIVLLISDLIGASSSKNLSDLYSETLRKAPSREKELYPKFAELRRNFFGSLGAALIGVVLIILHFF